MRHGVFPVPLALFHHLLDHLEGDQKPGLDGVFLPASYSFRADPVFPYCRGGQSVGLGITGKSFYEKIAVRKWSAQRFSYTGLRSHTPALRYPAKVTQAK